MTVNILTKVLCDFLKEQSLLSPNLSKGVHSVFFRIGSHEDKSTKFGVNSSTFNLESRGYEN